MGWDIWGGAKTYAVSIGDAVSVGNSCSHICLHSSICMRAFVLQRKASWMGLEPSREGTLFMNISVRCWTRIRSRSSGDS